MSIMPCLLTRDSLFSKLTSVLVSLFTSHYVLRWGDHFPDTPLRSAPAFDARAVAYPSDSSLRDYLSWRQADCHINNQYNAAFWALVQRGGLSRDAAQARLAGSLAADKNELLFSEFGINYAHLPPLHRKGSILRRGRVPVVLEGKTAPDGVSPVVRQRSTVLVEHVDLIGDAFWAEHPELLAG